MHISLSHEDRNRKLSRDQYRSFYDKDILKALFFYLLYREIKKHNKGPFKNYVDKILTIFVYLPTLTCTFFTLMPYPCSHFYFDIKFGDRLYSKENRPGSPLLF